MSELDNLRQALVDVDNLRNTTLAEFEDERWFDDIEKAIFDKLAVVEKRKLEDFKKWGYR
jgi:hypothetical protein